jgi:hypothetical protein
MFYALCHAVDSFLGKDKNAPKKSPAGMACRCFAARLCRPPRFGRYAPSSLRPAQPRKTNSHRIYRTDVALTQEVFKGNKKFRQPMDVLTGRKITLNPDRDGKGLILETSAARLLQGHNVCGTNKMHFLCYKTARRIYKLLGLKKTTEKVRLLKNHDYDIDRSDVTGWFNVGSQTNVVSAMAEIRRQLLALGVDLVVHETRDGIETIYIGKHSRHATLKFYNKYLELQHSGFPPSLSEEKQKAILDFARPLIRVERTLRTPALKAKKADSRGNQSKLRQSSGWTTIRARQLLVKSLGRYKFNGHIRARLDLAEIEGMKPSDRTLYLLQQSGVYLTEFMLQRDFIRVRNRLLQRYQIDIAHPAFDEPAAGLSLAELLAPEKLQMTWPKKLSRMGLIAGADEWK